MQLDVLQQGAPARSSNVQKILVIGGLQVSNSLHEATQWLAQNLRHMNGPAHIDTYMKGTSFERLFSGNPNAEMMVTQPLHCSGDRPVLATEDLPLQFVCANMCKLFLPGLHWQLGQWGSMIFLKS